MGDISQERKSGCGLLNVVFGGRSLWPKRLYPSPKGTSPARTPPDPTPTSGQTAETTDQKQSNDRIIQRPGQNYTKPPPVYQQQQQHQQCPQKPPQNQIKPEPRGPISQQGYVRKVPLNTLGISGELESMIADHQRTKGAGNLVRASSSNMMLHGSLGNLRQPGENVNSTNAMGYMQSTVSSEERMGNNGGKYAANPVKKKEESSTFCRALSIRMDPEELKIMGNEDYKNGRFAEALALYDAAIAIDPNKASYRSNKSAALTALGKLLEAAFECREAIRIDPAYQRAHNRLGTLYVRLGEAEKALYHYKQAGPEAEPDAIDKAKKVQNQLMKCTEAKSHRDWNSVLKETGIAMAAGADSAPLIIALKAEALFKLNRHQEAIEAMTKGPDFEIDACAKFFGPIGSASLLVMHAQVDMAEGRFDDAVSAAQRACRLDSNNRDANAVLRKTKGVAAARSHGNELFKAGKHNDSCNAYTEGLSLDPRNAILLCNRAASKSKLNQFDKAIEDCTAALNVRPAYTKARLRRADCFAKVENWGACVQDYEVLLRENPDDEDVRRMLNEAKEKLRRQPHSDVEVGGHVRM